MGRVERLALIEEIERRRDTRLIAAVWGDRQGHETVIAPDAPPNFFEHLRRFGKVKKIDVLLYSTGGHTLASWALANMVREYCDELAVLVPHRALSAATLFALAADELVMSHLGQLSPIDPSITSPLGPTVQIPAQPGQQRVIPISVEDVIGFLELAKTEAGIENEDAMLPIFEQLASQVHPLALGAVFRSRAQIQMLADRLLSFHMGGESHKVERNRIVSLLTRELGSHDYLIGRSEVKNRLKLNVVDVPEDVDQCILRLFDEYADLLEMRVPYNAEGFLGTRDSATGNFNQALLESREMTHFFRTTKTITRVQVQQANVPGTIAGIQEGASFEGWVMDAEDSA